MGRLGAVMLRDRVIAAARHVENGYRGLRSFLVAQDRNGNKMLERQQLTDGLEAAGVYLTQEDYDEIYARFDFNDDGSVHYDELLHGIRCEMNAHRTLQVRKLFNELDPNQNKVVYLADIERAYRPVGEDPATETQALIDALDAKKKSSNGLVTFAEISDFFCDVGQTLSDEEFGEMMQRKWCVGHNVGGDEAESSMSKSMRPRRAEELEEYNPRIRLPPHLDPDPAKIASLSFDSNQGDHNINSPNRANRGQGCIYNREKPVRRAPEFGTYCAADLRPDLLARFPERGSLDPANRSTESHASYTGKPFAPRVAQSTWKAEDSLRQISSEYEELATAPLVTTDPSGMYDTSTASVYKPPTLGHFVEVGPAKIPGPRDRYRGGFSPSMQATFKVDEPTATE